MGKPFRIRKNGKLLPTYYGKVAGKNVSLGTTDRATAVVELKRREEAEAPITTETIAPTTETIAPANETVITPPPAVAAATTSSPFAEEAAATTIATTTAATTAATAEPAANPKDLAVEMVALAEAATASVIAMRGRRALPLPPELRDAWTTALLPYATRWSGTVPPWATLAITSAMVIHRMWTTAELPPETTPTSTSAPQSAPTSNWSNSSHSSPLPPSPATRW